MQHCAIQHIEGFSCSGRCDMNGNVVWYRTYDWFRQMALSPLFPWRLQTLYHVRSFWNVKWFAWLHFVWYSELRRINHSLCSTSIVFTIKCIRWDFMYINAVGWQQWIIELPPDVELELLSSPNAQNWKERESSNCWCAFTQPTKAEGQRIIWKERPWNWNSKIHLKWAPWRPLQKSSLWWVINMKAHLALDVIWPLFCLLYVEGNGRRGTPNWRG